MASTNNPMTAPPQDSMNETIASTISTLTETTYIRDNDTAVLNVSDASLVAPSFPDLRSALGPINFTFSGLSTSDLYIPDDKEDFISSIVPNQNTSTTVSTAVQCINNATFCPTTTDFIQTRIFTDEDLWAENDHFAINLIPAMIFVGILMIFGIFGNLLVVYVFGFRFKSATQHFLIVCLACFDLLMSCIAMPTEIADMRFHHTFSSLFACKLLRFITMFSSISSSFTLVTIAMDRHKRVTRPLKKQMTIKRARIWELINVLGALFFSWPLLVMTGLRTSETRIPGLLGRDCSFSDDYHETKFPLAYNAVLGIGFITLITVIGVLYFRIWKTAKGHRVYMANRTRGSVSGTSLCELRNNAVSICNGNARIASEIKDTRLGNKRGSDANGETSPRPIIHVGSLPCLRGPHDDMANGFSVTPPVLEMKAEISGRADNEEQHSLPISAKGSVPSLSHINGSIKPNNITYINTKCKNMVDSKNIISNSWSNESPEGDINGRRRAASLTQLPKTQTGLPLTVPPRPSPTGSPYSLTPSPVLRSKSLKLQQSYSPSITSDDLRPMSSLMDSLSKVLLNSSAVQNCDQSLWNDGIPEEVKINCQEKPGVGDARSSNKESVDLEIHSHQGSYVDENCCERPALQYHNNRGIRDQGPESPNESNIEKSQSNPDSLEKMDTSSSLIKPSVETDQQWSSVTCPKAETSVDSTVSVATNTTVVDKCPNSSEINTSLQISAPGSVGDNSTNTQEKNNIESCFPSTYEEPKDITAQRTESSTDSTTLAVLESPNRDYVQMSFMEMVSASDFSHLIGERSKPMAIPDNMMLVNDTTVDCLKQIQNDASSISNSENNSSFKRRKYDNNNSRSTTLSPNNRSTLSQDLNGVTENGIRLSNTASPCNKRRSTVVSVLERYRIRSASAASLDNITTTSYKSTSRRSVRQVDKTTIVAFAISTVFVLSFLPYLALMFVRAFVKDFDYNLGDGAVCVYNIFVRSYFLNSAVNPLLYGWLNERFRHECMRLLSCCFSKKVDK